MEVSNTPTHETKPKVVILIHADWCGHCQRLVPEWQQMKDSLTPEEKPKLIFEEIESKELDDKLPKVSNTYTNGNPIKYKGFPTIGTVERGQFKQYGGNRTAPELLEWVRSLVA